MTMYEHTDQTMIKISQIFHSPKVTLSKFSHPPQT